MRIESQKKAEGNDEALLYILQMIAGGAAWLVVASFVRHGIIAETLGFLSMCAASFPFAKRTWAAGLPVWRYCAGAIMGAAVGAAIRISFQ